MGSSYRQNSLSDLLHFEADPDPWIRKLDYRSGSDSCSFRQWLQDGTKKSFSSKFFAWNIYISLQRSHKTVDIKAFLNFLLFCGRMWIRTDNNYISGSGSVSGRPKTYGSGSGSGSGALRNITLKKSLPVFQAASHRASSSLHKTSEQSTQGT